MTSDTAPKASGAPAQPVSPLSQAGTMTAAPVVAKSGFRIDDKYIAPIFITCILIFGQISFGILDGNQGLLKTGLAIGSAIVTELALGKLLVGKWPHWASAYITGISVGILVRSPFTWPYLLCSSIAITSKYVLRYKGRHLWNPSNFGIAVMLIVALPFFSTLTVQFGNSIWAMVAIWTLGAIIITRLKRLHICATYVISFFVFAYWRTLIVHDSFASEAAPITGPMYQLFIFFMITDPPTTLKTKNGRMVVAFLVAAAEHVLRLFTTLRIPFVSPDFAVQIASHAPYFALTIVGPISKFVELYRGSAVAAAPRVVASS
jgi:Na+-translocating ferredoxin:NAD+ oxidoreductase RnfD subunit